VNFDDSGNCGSKAELSKIPEPSQKILSGMVRQQCWWKPKLTVALLASQGAGAQQCDAVPAERETATTFWSWYYVMFAIVLVHFVVRIFLDIRSWLNTPCTIDEETQTDNDDSNDDVDDEEAAKRRGREQMRQLIRYVDEQRRHEFEDDEHHDSVADAYFNEFYGRDRSENPYY
jgi:hypothetical protein